MVKVSLEFGGFHSLLLEIIVKFLGLVAQGGQLLLALRDSLLRLIESIHQAIKLRGEWLNLEQNF